MISSNLIINTIVKGRLNKTDQLLDSNHNTIQLRNRNHTTGTGGGLAVYIEPVLEETLQFLLEILFLQLLRYVEYILPMMVILQCSLVFTIPYLVNRIS